MKNCEVLPFYKAIDDYLVNTRNRRADVEKLVDTAIANSHKLGRKLFVALFSSNKNDDGLYINRIN